MFCLIPSILYGFSFRFSLFLPIFSSILPFPRFVLLRVTLHSLVFQVTPVACSFTLFPVSCSFPECFRSVHLEHCASTL